MKKERNMIDIDISDALREPGRSFPFMYEGCPKFGDIELEGPLNVQGEYSLEQDTMRVQGTVSAQVDVNCARCLREMQFAVEEAFSEVFVERAPDEDAYAYSREARRLSLDQLVRDLLLTVVPLQVLCREDCAGLCPNCGADLNQGPCGCAKDTPEDQINENNPFAKLKDLLKETGGNIDGSTEEKDI